VDCSEAADSAEAAVVVPVLLQAVKRLSTSSRARKLVLFFITILLSHEAF
jgi:hypothetical protein